MVAHNFMIPKWFHNFIYFYKQINQYTDQTMISTKMKLIFH